IVVINSDWFVGYFVGNTLWLIAIGYYVYITFLGYSALPFLKNTVVLLYPFALLGLLYVLSVTLGWNFTKGLCWFYKYRVQ
ncbi:protein unc-50 homolog, partial [Tachysurus ichikawai]